jgi:hypothetical protein
LHESVLPWLIDKMAGFLEDEGFINFNVDQVVTDGYNKGVESHGKSMEGEKKRKQDLIHSAEQRIIQKELERQARREARERRRKQQEFDKLRAEIKKSFIDKGEVKDGIANQDLLDVNGNYEKGKPFAGSLGGQLL